MFSNTVKKGKKDKSMTFRYRSEKSFHTPIRPPRGKNEEKDGSERRRAISCRGFQRNFRTVIGHGIYEWPDLRLHYAIAVPWDASGGGLAGMRRKKKKKAERRGGGGVVLASGSITNKIKGIRESGMFYDGGHETPLCPWIVKFWRELGCSVEGRERGEGQLIAL